MSKGKKIKVVGFEGEHKVTENLGYNHSRDCYAKAVLIEGEERIVVSATRSGPWRINRPEILPGLLSSLLPGGSA